MTQKAPEPPDYAAATREGITADIETLPSRLLTERAAAEGRQLYRLPDGSYTLNNAVGGRPVADFTGVGDDTRVQRDIQNQLALLQGGADITRGLEQNRYQDLLELLPQYNELNLDQQKKAYDASLDATEAGERRRLGLELEMRPQFTASELEAQRQAFDQSLDLSDRGTRRQVDLQAELLPQLNEAGLGAQRQTYDAALEAYRQQNPEASAAKLDLVRQLQEGIDRQGELTAAQRRRVEQNVRGAQASRGNVLGPAAGFDEALAVSGYGEGLAERGRAELMQFLQGEQGLMPNFQSTAAVNPLLPNSNAGSYQPNVPAFAPTTTSGPNLAPANVSRTSPWNVTNPGAGAAGAGAANTRFDQQMQVANMPNPWLEGLGAAGGIASAFI